MIEKANILVQKSDKKLSKGIRDSMLKERSLATQNERMMTCIFFQGRIRADL